MWPERRKNNKMADAGASSTPETPSTSNVVETIMNYLGFVKINFVNVPYATTGTVTIGVDLDGKLKSKDEYGNVREFLYI